MPKCTVCAKEVEDIRPMDVPYHVECAMGAWDRAIRSLARHTDPSLETALLPAVRMAYPTLANRPGDHRRSPVKTEVTFEVSRVEQAGT